jgi:hypothetical protein
MPSKHVLPDCDDVFRKFFAPWYRRQDLERRGFSATRPDAQREVAPGTTAIDASPLTAPSRKKVARQLATMREAAEADWPSYLAVEDSLSMDWIAAFDRYWTRANVIALVDRSDSSEFSNELLVTCCEFGVAMGEVMRAQLPQLEWLYDWPYWESALLDVPSGYRINVFHWSIKRFSEYGVDDGYVAKMGQCLDLVRGGWSGAA